MGKAKPIAATGHIAELFQILDKYGVSGKAIAEELGVPATRVSEWRLGKHIPNDHYLGCMADIVGVELRYKWVKKNH